MALILSKTGISTGNTLQAWHVTQSIDALSGSQAYDIDISGSFDVIGPTTLSGSSHTISGATTIQRGNIQLKGNTTINGYTLSTGQDNIVSGLYSFSQGKDNSSTGLYASSFGANNTSIGNSSTTFGTGSIASGSNQLVCGSYNKKGDNTSLFIVGNGTRDITRIDSFKVTHSSSIAIPQTASTEPNWAGIDGEMIPATISNNHWLYIYMKGAWRKIEMSDA
jgi:hypothetical protein